MMVHKHRASTTKYEIIREATETFLEKGYTVTSVRSIAAELDMTPGLLMYHFSTKEHLLCELVNMLCDFQWQLMNTMVDDGNSSLMALCLELATIAAVCEENEVLRDFYTASYSHPLTLGTIRKNDKERAKLIFADYCSDWTDEQFAEAEVLVSGTEYATFMTTGDEVPLDVRISGALNNIMTIYGIPEELRKMKIEKILAMDYRNIGLHILDEFKKFVNDTNEQIFEEL